MLHSRFMFETNDSLMLDLSQSGYPHSYMLARIASDRAEALSEHFKGETRAAGHYKQVFLDDLFKTGSVNRALLNKIACAEYAAVVAALDGAFDPRFMCGVPEVVEGGEGRYRLQWGAFDPSHNLPILCNMVFDYIGVDLLRSLAGLKLVLKHESRAGISIAALAHGIDTGTADIRPVTLSRAILGPLYLPGFTREESPWLGPTDTTQIPDPVIEITIDHTRAVGSRRPGALAVKFGVSPIEHQIYAICTTDSLCYERGADAVERIVILPHRMLQSMRSERGNEGTDTHVCVPYIHEGELL
jgi:hypothetical protein